VKQLGGRTIRLGWYWARTEIENYLIDPIVVTHALGLASEVRTRYQEILDRAVDKLSAYSAGRTALSLCRVRNKPFPNRWGKPRGSDAHPFPASLKKKVVLRQIKQIVENYSRHAHPEVIIVARKYKELLSQFRKGGIRRANFLHNYSGKDMLIQLGHELGSIGFHNFGAFREKILLGIEQTGPAIADWLPEWTAVRREVMLFTG
jgi:hypothetical protein